MFRSLPLFLLVSILSINVGKSQSLIVDNGTANNYQIIYPANFSGASPPAGFMVTFKAQFANTGNSSLKLNSYPIFPIKKNNNLDLDANDIKDNSFITVIYDGTNWQMLSVGANPVGTGGISGSGTIGGVAFFSNNSSLTADGGNFVWDNTNKRLGIGTNTPSTPLHIVTPNPVGDGIQFLAPNLTDNNITVFVQGRNPSLANQAEYRFRYVGNGNMQNAHAFGFNAIQPFVFFTANERVGIGVANPLNKLDVLGSMALGAYAGVNTPPANSLIVSGNIGIGQNSPVHKIHVNGGNIFGDQAYIASTRSIAASTAPFNTGAQSISQVRITDNGTALANGNLTYGATAVEGQYLWITNFDNENVTFSSAFAPNVIPPFSSRCFVFIGGSQWTMVGATGDNLGNHAATTQIQGTIGTVAAPSYTFNTNLTSGMYLINTNIIGIATNGANRYTFDGFGHHIINTASNGYSLNVGGALSVGLYGINNSSASDAPVNGLVVSGNVGIGTSTPGQNLVVVGNTSVAGIGYFGTIAGLALNGAPAGSITTVDGAGRLGFGTLLAGLSGTGTNGAVNFWTGADTQSADATNFFWDNTNKRLGIGTSTPQSLFHTIITTTGNLNTTVNLVRIDRESTGTPLNLFGSTIALGLDDASSALRDAGLITTRWTDAVGRFSDMTFSIYSSTATQSRIRAHSNGVIIGRSIPAGIATSPIDLEIIPSAAIVNFAGASLNLTGTANSPQSLKVGKVNTLNVTSGGLANSYAMNSIDGTLPISASSAATMNEAAALYINGSPTNGANMTISNSYSLWSVGRIRVDALATFQSAQITSLTNGILSVNGVGNVVLAPAGSSLSGSGTNGAVNFWTGANTQSADATNFFWDNTNKRLGIGTNAPQSRLVLSQTIANGGFLKLENPNNNSGDTWWIGFPHGAGSADANDRARIGVSMQVGGAGEIFFSTGTGGSQTERMRIGQTGNVGIGTSTPNTRLHVVGNSTVTGIAMMQNTQIASLSNGVLSVNGTGQVVLAPAGSSLSGSGTNGAINFWTGTNTQSADAPNLFWDNTNKRLGVGTIAPGSLLAIANGANDPTVYGTALQITNLDGRRQQFALIRNGFNVISAGYNGSSPTWGFGIGQTVDASFVPSYFNMNAFNGFIGINTTTPQNRVDINGGVAIGTYAGQSVAPANSLIISGQVGIGTTLPGALLSIANGANDPANYGNALQITNENGRRQQIAFIRNGFNVLSAGYNGTTDVWGFGQGNITDVSFNPNFFNINAINGNVGIGTVSPFEQLTIANDAPVSILSMSYVPGVNGASVLRLHKARGTRASPAAILSGDVIGRVNFAGQYGNGAGQYDGGFGMRGEATENFTSTTNVGGKLIFTTIQNATGTAIDRMTIDHNGFLGIGVPSPSSIFHVRGTSPIAIIDANAASQQSSIVFAETGITRWQIGKQTNNSFFIYDQANSRDALQITNSTNIILAPSVGNVGIGTSTPNQKLTVQGNASVTGSGYFGYSISTDNNINDGFGSPMSIQKSRGGGAVLNGDEIGWLEFRGMQSGAMRRSAMIYALVDGIPSGNFVPGSLSFHTAPAGGFDIERMRILSNGNIGIATNNPVSKFDVNGSNGEAIVTSNANFVLNENHSTLVLLTNGGLFITIPAANTCPRRIYRVVNTAATNSSFSINYVGFGGGTSNLIPFNAPIMIQSDGTNWYRIQ